jgi:hypothetical protein
MIGTIKVYVCHLATGKYHACYLSAIVARIRKEVIFKGNCLKSNSILQEVEYTKFMQMKPSKKI